MGERILILRNSVGFSGVATLVAGMVLTLAPARAQGLFEFFKNNATSSYAPSDEGRTSLPPPLSIIPVNPRAGDLNSSSKKGADAKKQPVQTPVPASKPEEEEEDGDTVFEHETPKVVRIPLPVARPDRKSVV